MMSPDGVAHKIMTKPGYIGKLTRETINIVKCIPTEVKIQQLDRCYQELPVLRNNKTCTFGFMIFGFMLPRTHKIIQIGTEIPSSKILPQQYKIDGLWYKLIPSLSELENPIQLNQFIRQHGNTRNQRI